VTWAEVEEQVALSIALSWPKTAHPCRTDEYKAMARAAIKTMQELRLTAVVPDV
jgi:hypothetical protein